MKFKQKRYGNKHYITKTNEKKLNIFTSVTKNKFDNTYILETIYMYFFLI